MEKSISKGRKHLEEMRDIDRFIKQLNMQIEQEESMLTDISVHYKEVNVQSSGAKDMISEKVPEIVELQQSLEEYVKELEQKKLVTLSILKKMKNRRRAQLLLLYYMQNKTLEQTAEAMDKSYTWTWEEMQEAITDFERLFKKRRKESSNG